MASWVWYYISETIGLDLTIAMPHLIQTEFLKINLKVRSHVG